MNYTSLKLSKLLFDNGCELESDFCWAKTPENDKEEIINNLSVPDCSTFIPAYDILNDICVKFAKEFFRIKEIVPYGNEFYQEHVNIIASNIIRFLQQNKKQEAEDYIWEHCLFNKNKKR